MTKMTEHDTTIQLPHGRQLSLDAVDPTDPSDESRVLTIADPLGAIELEIVLGPNGPLVRVSASALELRTTGSLSLECERFQVDAREGIELRSNGDLVQSVAGDVSTKAGGALSCEGKSLRLRARRGEAQIEAHDDVRIDGERVLLNS